MKYSVTRGDSVRDKRTLLRLWTQYLPGGRGSAEARYRWIYEGNPDGRPLVWLARDSSGTPIGAASVAPRRFCFRGRDLRAGQAIDLVVEPRHRRVLPALLLQRNIVRELPDLGLDAVYGFANQRAEKIFLRAGYRLLGRFERSSKLLRSRQRLRSILRWEPILRAGSRVLDAGLRIAFDLRTRSWFRGLLGSVKDGVDPEVGRLWRKRARAAGVPGVRDLEFLSWRFGGGPGESSVYHVSTEEESLVGYVVFSTVGRKAQIKDFLSTDAGALGSVLTSFTGWARGQGLDSVSTSFLGSRRVRRTLRRCGFFPRERTGAVVVYPSPSLDPAQRADLEDADQWFLTIADRDV